MNKKATGEKLVVEKLLMKKSYREENTFVGRVKLYEDTTGEFKGEVVVLAKDLPADGKYKITARKMSNGRGWITEKWEKTYDLIEVKLSEDKRQVIFCVNGRQDKLRGEDGKNIPLYFNPVKYFPPEIILKNIKKKLKFLCIEEHFDFNDFSAYYLELCAEVEKNHKKFAKKNNTGENLDLSKLTEKYGR